MYPFYPNISKPEIEYSNQRIEDFRDLDNFDLMLDVAETNNYILNYFRVAENWNIPRVRKILYTVSQKELSFKTVLRYIKRGKWISTHDLVKYLRKFEHYPLVYENPVLQRAWSSYKFKNGRVILNTVDPWFTSKWIGDKKSVFAMYNGAFSWRKHAKETQIIADVFSKIDGYLHDAYLKWLSLKDLILLMSHYRVYFEIGAGRPLTLAFQQAMSLGMPVVVYNKGPTCYSDIIHHGINGFTCPTINGVEACCKLLLKNYDLAKHIGKNARETAEQLWSTKVIKPLWEQTFREALEV